MSRSSTSWTNDNLTKSSGSDSKDMTVKDIIEQIEGVFGRQPQAYMFRLINDGLNEISELGIGYGNSDSPGHEVKISDKYEKCDIIGKKGTLYIQHGDLIHGSYSNETKDETRGMYSATYIPKGEKFLPGANSRRRAILV